MEVEESLRVLVCVLVCDFVVSSCGKINKKDNGIK